VPDTTVSVIHLRPLCDECLTGEASVVLIYETDEGSKHSFFCTPCAEAEVPPEQWAQSVAIEEALLDA